MLDIFITEIKNTVKNTGKKESIPFVGLLQQYKQCILELPKRQCLFITYKIYAEWK